MKVSENFIEMSSNELESCDGGGFVWSFLGGVWVLISDAWG